MTEKSSLTASAVASKLDANVNFIQGPCRAAGINAFKAQCIPPAQLVVLIWCNRLHNGGLRGFGDAAVVCRGAECGGRKMCRRGASTHAAPDNTIHTIHTIHTTSAARNGIANHSGYAELWCKKSPQEYAAQTAARLFFEPAAAPTDSSEGGFLRGLSRAATSPGYPAFFA